MKSSILCLTTILLAGSAFAQTMNSIYNIPLKDIQQKDAPLIAYKGKVLLLVNVASKCGFTKQYKGLQELYDKYKDRGLVIVGIPSNDFGGQEPGSPEEIVAFCHDRFGVAFPLMEKAKVKSGEGQHPLYLFLTGPDAKFPGDVKWNFGKFLIGRDGTILQRYDSKTKPEDTELVRAVEAALEMSSAS